MPTTYSKTTYSIPACSISIDWKYGSSTTYGDWVAMSIPAQTGTYFTVPELNLDYIKMIRAHGMDLWSITSTLQLADATGYIRATYNLGSSEFASYTGGAATFNFEATKVITANITKCRLSISTVVGGYFGAPVKGDVSLSASSLHVYKVSSTGTPADIEINKTDGLLQMSSMSATIEKYRYRADQTVSGIGLNWNVTPVSFDGGKFISLGS